MQFVKPISFEEALALIGDKSPIGAMLSSSEWSDVPVALRLRAMFSADVENVRFLQRAQDALGDFLDANKTDSPNGPMLATGSRAAFIDQLREFAIAQGMGPLDPEDAGGLKDITSEQRLGLIFDTLTRQADDYGYWRQGQDPEVINEFPAQRFIRVMDVKEPRTSHTQFEDQVYLKNDPIWANVINEDFHVPWGPWAWGCGHDVEDVDRTEAVSLGLIDEGQQVEPDVKNFNENLQASTRGLDPDLLAKMKDDFGDQLVFDGDTMKWGDTEEVPSPMPNVQPAAPEAGGTAALPGATDLESALSAHEDILSKRAGTEKLVVLDDQGKVLLERVGGRSSVPIFPDDAEALQDSIVTHNHPMGRSFSDADLRTAAKMDVAEIRAVGVAQPFTYSLERPATGWPANMARRYNEILDEVQTEYVQAILNGDITEVEAAQGIHHEVMVRLAAELKLNYERTQR